MNYFESLEIQKPDFDKRKLSYSSLKKFLKSPLHFIEYLNTKFEQSDEMLLGSVLDCMIFEPNELANRYQKYNKFPRRSNDAKAKWEEMQQEAKDGKFTWVDSEIWERAEMMESQLKRNPQAMFLINNCGEAQKRLEWSYNGIPTVGYLDGTGTLGHTGNRFIVDLKTSSNSSRDFWTRQIINMNYDLQAAMYVYAWKQQYFENASFYHIVIENKAPFTVNVYPISTDFIQSATKLYKHTMDQFATCMELEQWDQGYSFFEEPNQPLEIPDWYASRIEKLV